MTPLSLLPTHGRPFATLPLFALLAVTCAAGVPTYRDPSAPVDARVSDLLSRMTLQEKARQLDMYDGCKSFIEKSDQVKRNRPRPDAPLKPDKAREALGTLGAGSVHDFYPSARLYNEAQAWVIASNRLGIPALFIEEGLHGYQAMDQTVFPQSIALATTWNEDLAEKTGAAIAAEARAVGVAMILGPVLDVARDPRWGRTEEDFGEDPYLTGRMGLAIVRGMQGDSLATDHTCISEPKHFAGHGSPESGLNTSPVHAGEREVRTVMLKSFEPAVREGHAMSLMAAYHDIDGVPCSANPWLLTTVLRDEWGFQGFVLSDLGAIRRLYTVHHVAATPEEAVQLALKSGVDMQFYDFDHDTFQNAIRDGVRTEKLSQSVLDSAVSRVLRAKFLLGLFDHPFVDVENEKRARRSAAHLDLSLESARQSMCLLKNTGNLLPLSKSIPSLAIIGPEAKYSMLGDYADGASPTELYGIAAQVSRLVSRETRVSTCDGTDINEAVRMAANASVVIMALGEPDGASGEGHDRQDLGLPGNQENLLEAVAKTGKPLVLVLQNGRALGLPWAVEHVPAILEAWYAGEFSGRAVAETLFGDNAPAGRLTVTFPKSVGQLPVFYNHSPSKGKKYVDGDETPLFPFGHGLSYTSFSYREVKVTPPEPGSGGDVVVTTDLANTGSRDSDEVCQVYIRQKTASVATPIEALKGFTRVHLKAGEHRLVTLRIRQSDLEIWGAGRTWKLEPGDFTATIGGSSVGGTSVDFTLR